MCDSLRIFMLFIHVLIFYTLGFLYYDTIHLDSTYTETILDRQRRKLISRTQKLGQG